MLVCEGRGERGEGRGGDEETGRRRRGEVAGAQRRMRRHSFLSDSRSRSPPLPCLSLSSPPTPTSLRLLRPSPPEIRQERPNQLPVNPDLIRQQKRIMAAVALDVAVAHRLAGGDQGIDDLPRLERREEPVAGEAHQQPAAGRPLQGRGQFLRRARRDRTDRSPCSSVR